MNIMIAKFGHRRQTRRVRNGMSAGVAFAVAFLIAAVAQLSAGTGVNFTKNGDLTATANYSSAALPSNTTDVQITSSTAALTDSSTTTLKMESLNLTDSSPKSTYTLTDRGTGNSTLTLGNSAGFTNNYSSVANDLIYLQDTNLTITGSYGASYGTQTLALASSGNFDLVAGTYSVNPTLTISASISGAYGITTTGTGTLNLNANNTFSGPFAASGSSTVALGASGALGSVSAVNLSGSAVAYFSILSLSNVINSTASVSLSGTSALQTEGSAQTVASLTGASGTAMYIGDYVSTATPPVTTAGSFTVGDSTSTTYAGTIIGTHTSSTAAILTKQGTGVLTLSGTNTYSGVTAITAGGLIITNASGLGATGAGNGTTVSSGAGLGLSGGIAVGAEALTLNGTGIAANPSGALRNVSGANSFAGAITLNSASTINTSAGSLALTGGITNGGSLLTFDGAGNTTVSTTAVTGTGGLTKNGSGTLTLSAANTFSGTTTPAAGTLDVANQNALQNSTLALSSTGGAVMFDNAVSGNAFTIGGLSGDGGLALVNNAATPAAIALSVGGNNASTSHSGVISGAGSLTKLGTGTLTLTGNNTYSGATTINAGTLLAANTAGGAALGGISQVNINNGATLQYGADNQVAAPTIVLGGGTGTGSATFNAAGFNHGTTSATGVGALTLNATATIDFGAGNNGNVLHFANSGATTWTSGSTLYIVNYAGSVMQQDGSTITGNGNALFFGNDATGLNSTQITQVDFINPSGYTGTYGASIDATGMVFADVPEPATWAGGLLLIGAAGWNLRRRSGRRQMLLAA